MGNAIADRTKKWMFVLPFVLLLSAVLANNAIAEQRLALVIGNAEYDSKTLPPLKNPANDAVLIADSLEKYTSRKIDVAVRMLEPVMLLIMTTIVTFVIAALLLPILNMSSVR